MRYLFVLLLLAGCNEGRYQLVTARGSSANEERIWVIDTNSGRLTLCYYYSALTCTSAVQAMK